MSKRIESSNVQLGSSFVIGHNPSLSNTGSFDEKELTKEELYAQLKEKEFRQKLDSMLNEAQNKASLIVQEAKNQASVMKEQAEQEIEKSKQELEDLINNVIEEARQEGISAGYEEGLEKACTDVYSKVANLETVADAAFKAKKEIILSAEKEMLELSIAVAERILKKQLEIKPSMITEIIRAAVMELKDKEEIKIIVNPALKEELYSFSDELKNSVKGMRKIKIVEDKTIHPGSAIVESLDSRVDARLETQIDAITQEIMKEFQNEPVLETEVIKPLKAKKAKD